MARKRYRRAKDGEFRISWGSLDGDPPCLVYSRGKGVAGPDGHLLCFFFESTDSPSGKSLVDELTARGYDISTLEFVVKKKAPCI